MYTSFVMPCQFHPPAVTQFPTDVIANVVKFLGVRSLVRFGATSKSHWVEVVKEGERRKAYIAKVEVEVARLMSSQKQPTNLASYINRKIKLYSGNLYKEQDPDNYIMWSQSEGLSKERFNELKTLYSRMEKENGDI